MAYMIEKYVLVDEFFGSLHFELWNPNYKYGNVSFCLLLN